MHCPSDAWLSGITRTPKKVLHHPQLNKVEQYDCDFPILVLQPPQLKNVEQYDCDLPILVLKCWAIWLWFSYPNVTVLSNMIVVFLSICYIVEQYDCGFPILLLQPSQLNNDEQFNCGFPMLINMIVVFLSLCYSLLSLSWTPAWPGSWGSTLRPDRSSSMPCGSTSRLTNYRTTTRESTSTAINT